MRFTKWFAAGKDYILIDAVTETQPYLPAPFSQLICDRHTGAGADGMVVLERSARADVRAVAYSPNGTNDELDPLGIVCAATFAVQRRIVEGPSLRLEMGPQVRYVTVDATKKGPIKARIDLGPPVLQADRIPSTLPGNPPVDVPVTFPDTMYNVTVVKMGAPYAVIFVRDVSESLVREIGSQLEKHPGFPEGTSVAFVQVKKMDDVNVRVWERGIGESPASGMGAAAVAVAGSLTGRTRRSVSLNFGDGSVEVEWRQADNHVHLTCAATEVYSGVWSNRV